MSERLETANKCCRHLCRRMNIGKLCLIVARGKSCSTWIFHCLRFMINLLVQVDSIWCEFVERFAIIEYLLLAQNSTHICLIRKPRNLTTGGFKTCRDDGRMPSAEVIRDCGILGVTVSDRLLVASLFYWIVFCCFFFFFWIIIYNVA